MNRLKGTMLIALLLGLAVTQSACWETAEPGTVKIQTIWDQPTGVIRGSGQWTIDDWGDSYYEMSLKTFTHPLSVSAGTKDNAALTLNMAVTAHVLDNDTAILAQVKKFGTDPEDRAGRILTILDGMVATKARDAIIGHDAYSMLKEQQAIQLAIFEAIKAVAREQLFLEIESVQITGRPYFQNQEIEHAASAVVAAVKKKEAAQAELEAERIAQERKQLEAATYARSPQTLELEKLDKQIRIAEAWAKHSGPLIFGSAGSLQTVLGKE